MSKTIDLDIPRTAAERLARVEENLAYNGIALYGPRLSSHLLAFIADYREIRTETLKECAGIVRAEMQRGPRSTRLGAVLDAISALSPPAPAKRIDDGTSGGKEECNGK